MTENHQLCARCVMDTSAPSIRFDADGTCNYCSLHDRIEETNKRREGTIEELCERIKRENRKAAYDCVVGVSGGTDSTYCLYMVKKLGLRPLAVHFDNGWVSDAARANIAAASERLGVEVRSVAPDWEFLRRAYRACLDASIPELCMPCEIGISSSLYRVAAEAGVHHIILGHSYRTEGITPLKWHYLDGRYFRAVLEQAGLYDQQADDFNRLGLSSVAIYMLWNGIRTIQLPLYVRDYRDADVRALLSRELGWTYGGHHHFDCFYKPLVSYLQQQKYHVDLRRVTLSALIRSGQQTRAEALATLSTETRVATDEELAFCLERLGMTREDLDRVIATPPKSFGDFPTVYSLLSLGKIPLRVAGKLGLVPETLYEKLFET